MFNDKLSALYRRFPLGCEVINLGSIHAVVWNYNVHVDGSCDLILRERKPDGAITDCQWTADPDKCERVLEGMVHQHGFVVFT